MKYRQGYVSNSSSSSFIVAYDSINIGKACETCGHVNRDFSDIIRQSSSCETEIERESIYKIKENVKNNFFCYENDDSLQKEIYDKIDEYDKKGWDIIDFSLDYEDQYIKEEMKALLDKGKLIEIYDNEN